MDLVFVPNMEDRCFDRYESVSKIAEIVLLADDMPGSQNVRSPCLLL